MKYQSFPAGAEQSLTQVWVPPRESEASRLIHTKTNSSNRLSLFNAQANRRMDAESLLEAEAMLVLRARRDVQVVKEQPEPLEYVDGDGVLRPHTFDLLAVYDNGCRVAYAVKPLARVAPTRLDITIELIRRQCLWHLADKAVILTERQISKARVWNAEQVLRSRAMRNENDRRALLSVVAKIGGEIRVHDLLAATPEPGQARTAMWCLIDEGVIEHATPNPTHTRIRDTSFVRVNQQNLAAAMRSFQ